MDFGVAVSKFSMFPLEHLYSEGDFYIGTTAISDHLGNWQYHALGVTSERHALTIAGTRAGKGAAVIIPNLKLWNHNILVIDPKGEAVKATATDRERLGQSVYVVDPFTTKGIPKKYRASYNPLTDLNVDALTIKEDITTISDGIIMRANGDAEHWDSGAQRILSGLIAYALLELEPHEQNLIEIRAIIRDEKRFASVVEKMKTLDGCEGLAQAGASAVWAKEGGYFVSNLDKNTEWLDSKAMRNALTESTFSMRDLKREKASVYLVLPPKYVAQHGRFLRLFVRCGIDVMSDDDVPNERRCLFMLDEFFTLGYIDEIAKAAGLMAGYGLQMWIILQNLGQLTSLYGRDGAETFFGNSDIHQFFGNRDPQSLKWVSEQVGSYDLEDLPNEPTLEESKEALNFHERQAVLQAKHDKEKENRQHQFASFESRKMLDLMGFVDRHYNEQLSKFQTDASRQLGKPRMSPQQVSHLVRKETKIDPLALAMIAFTGQKRPLIAKLGAHWEMDNIIWDMSPAEIYEWAKEPEKQEEPTAEEPLEEKPKASFWKGIFD